MSREEVLAKVIEFAAMAFNKDASTITEKTNISQELGVASMQRVAMSASIENDFRLHDLETLRQSVILLILLWMKCKENCYGM